MTTADDSFDGARLISRAALLLAAIAGAFALAHAIHAWPAMPDRVPTHFGAAGLPDAWSSKSLPTVFVLPVMALVGLVGLSHTLFLYWLGVHKVLRVPPRHQAEFVGIALVLLILASTLGGAAASSLGLF